MFEDPPRKSLAETPASELKKAVLDLGQVVATTAAMTALEAAGESGLTYLQRHQCGDWGELDREDWAAND